MCIMMARLRPMTFSPTGMPACLRASSRQSNAARSCAKHDPERNVLGCSQTLKNDTLTHPSLWADHSYFWVSDTAVGVAVGQDIAPSTSPVLVVYGDVEGVAVFRP